MWLLVQVENEEGLDKFLSYKDDEVSLGVN